MRAAVGVHARGDVCSLGNARFVGVFYDGNSCGTMRELRGARFYCRGDWLFETCESAATRCDAPGGFVFKCGAISSWRGLRVLLSAFGIFCGGYCWERRLVVAVL